MPCINVSQPCTFRHCHRAHVAFFLGAETPMPVSAMHRVLLSTSKLSDETLPLVNNGESTATRNTKISYRGSAGATNSSATKRSGEQTTPAKATTSPLCLLLAISAPVYVSLFMVSPPPAAAPPKVKVYSLL